MTNPVIKLHLGVVDVAYSDQEGKATTTGDVEEILEENYSVMAAFYELHKQEIADELANAIAGDIESLMMGKIAQNNFGASSTASISGVDIARKVSELTNQSASGASAMSKIDAMFRNFLDAGEMEKLGVVSMAAKNGVNHRKKRPYVQANPARPAFIDTGLYQSSFRSWID